jgi:hypothetical protein
MHPNLRRLRLPILLFLAVLAAGCATTSHVMLAPARPAIAPEQVHVYFTPPPGRYEQIAALETSSGPFTYGDQRKTDAVMAKLRAEAAKLGANGVLVQGMGMDGQAGRVGVGVGGGSFGGHTRVGGGIGVDVSPAQKHAQALAIFVY